MGTHTHLGAQSQSSSLKVPVLKDHKIGPKIVENGHHYSTAPWRNMRRSARGTFVQ